MTLEIQHCALKEDETVLSDLCFISAKCSQRNLSYLFKQVDGGGGGGGCSPNTANMVASSCPTSLVSLLLGERAPHGPTVHICTTQ